MLVDVPQNVLQERKRKGLDIRDEVWEEVLHMVPSPSHRHQWFAGQLYSALFPRAADKGLRLYFEFNVYRPEAGDRDYRVPDLVAAHPDHVSERAVEGEAELAIEIRSPNDETYKKLGFYAEVGVKELLVIDLDPEGPPIKLFRLSDGELKPVEPQADGSVRLIALDVAVTVADRPAGHPVVRLEWASGGADIPIE